MNKRESMEKKIRYFLMSRFIDYIVDYDEDGHERFTMIHTTTTRNSCSITTESCVYFYKNVMEWKTYYSDDSETGTEFFKKSNHKADLMFLINFINSAVWVCPADGMNGELYQPTPLFSPRLYIDEYEDLSMTTLIPYDFFEIAPLETLDFVSASVPNLMLDLLPTILGLLLGKYDLNTSINLIKKDILNERKIEVSRNLT